VRRLFAVVTVVAAGCGPSSEPSAEPVRERVTRIVNGTRAPQNVALTAGAQLAIGYLAYPSGSEFCTGTLIGSHAVVTARHCTKDQRPDDIWFGMGLDPAAPDAFLPVAEILEHPSIDFTLLLLGEDAQGALPAVEPIAMNREALTSAWAGRWVDASGFGDTYSSETGRFFASVQIIGYGSTTVTVDGHGQQGICFGDSGGPILYQAGPAAAVVIVGTEQWGDESCVDVDHLTRVDVVAPWVDEKLPGTYAACDQVDAVGQCDGSVVSFCNGYWVHEQDCAATGERCGLKGPRGYGCLPLSCGDVDYRGVCTDDVVTWCSSAGPVERDCKLDSRVCAQDDQTGRYTCDCTRCGGACVNFATSLAHCGGCGQACSFAHASGACVDRGCKITSCEKGWLDKDGKGANGCEQQEDTGCAAVEPSVLLMLTLAGLGRRRRF